MLKIKDDVDLKKLEKFGFIYLNKILDYFMQSNIHHVQMGNIIISYEGVKLDTLNGKRQIFKIQRSLEE